MSRPYDGGLRQYAAQHRLPEQECRHILANALLAAVHANVGAYESCSAELNYRMGSFATNHHVDMQIDACLVDMAQGTGGYNSRAMAHNREHPISYEQQAGHLHTRFHTAKEFLARTGDKAYEKILHLIHKVVATPQDEGGLHGAADLREFRMPGH